MIWEGKKSMSPENKNEVPNNEMINSTTNVIENKSCENVCGDIGKQKTWKKYYNSHREEINRKARKKYKEKCMEKIWELPCPECGVNRTFKCYRWYNTAMKTKTRCHNCKKPLSYLDLTGKRFNRLLVIKKLSLKDRTKDNHLNWLCKCDCGKEVKISGRNLIRGVTGSCGCYNRDKMKKKPFMWIYNCIIRTASVSERECNLTYEEFLEFTKINHCHYCNTEIKWLDHYSKGDRMAYYLDRKNNNEGYSKNNCVVCCSECNFIKSNRFTCDEMLKIGSVLTEIYLGRLSRPIKN